MYSTLDILEYFVASLVSFLVMTALPKKISLPVIGFRSIIEVLYANQKI